VDVQSYSATGSINRYVFVLDARKLLNEASDIYNFKYMMICMFIYHI